MVARRPLVQDGGRSKQLPPGDCLDAATLAPYFDVLPSVRPSLMLDFVNRATLDTRVVWARASVATCHGPDGLVKVVPANQPRFDHDPITRKRLGVLIEESRTNLTPYSQDFAVAGWSKTAVALVPAAGLAPDGTYSATKAIATAANTAHFWDQSVSTTTAYTYTRTLYAKAAERSKIRFENYSNNAARQAHVSFDLVAGTFMADSVTSGSSQSYSAQALPNGWWRITQTFSLGGSETAMYCRCTLLDASGNTSVFAGDNQAGVLVWGHQMEVGFNASTYMPTPVTWSARATTATYFDSTGKLVTAASGAARYGFKFDGQRWISQGLIAEIGAVNYMLYSDQFDNSGWAKSDAVITANAGVAPDGTTTADKVMENTVSAEHFVSQRLAKSAAVATNVASVFVKRLTGTRNVGLQLYSDGFAGGVSANFNLDTGTVMGVGAYGSGFVPGLTTIENCGGGWYRVSLAVTTDANNSVNLQVGLRNNDLQNYTGDGASSLLMWGAQLEAGTISTSYIPTQGAAVQRNADTVTSVATLREADYPWMPIGAWYNPYEGSMFASADLGQLNAYLWEFTDGGTLNRILVRGNGNGGAVGFQLSAGANWSASSASVPVPIALGAIRICAMGWDRTGLTVVDGGAPGTTGGTQQPSQCNQLRLGHSISGGVSTWLNGHLRQLHYYPQRLSGAELQGIAA